MSTRFFRWPAEHRVGAKTWQCERAFRLNRNGRKCNQKWGQSSLPIKFKSSRRERGDNSRMIDLVLERLTDWLNATLRWQYTAINKRLLCCSCCKKSVVKVILDGGWWNVTCWAFICTVISCKWSEQIDRQTDREEAERLWYRDWWGVKDIDN